MTAWWVTTTRVRKVRVRSSAALRVVAFGTARISAGAAELEMDVMCAPARVVVTDVAAGSPFQQGATRQNADMSRLAGRRFRPVRVSRKGWPMVDFGQRATIKRAGLAPVTGTSPTARS